ncbi:MAG: hypothetical protein Q8N37_02925 [bacterium]|nr:hypothetical protein [bacterium]
MGEFRTFKKIKIEDDREGETYAGIRLRPAADGDGYYVESLEDHLKNAFITEGTYQAILADEEVTIHI